MPPSAVSTTTNDSINDDIQLPTPQPDITVGLASECIKKASNTLRTSCICDPYQVPFGLRFPLLVVEAKGLTTGGNLIYAQNQAALTAASALNIFSDLDALIPNVNVDADHSISLPHIVYSLVSDGPTHELWVHYRTGDEYDMSCLES